MANLRANKIVGIGSTDAGTTFDGPISLNTQGYMYFPTGNTTNRGRGRAMVLGGIHPEVTRMETYSLISSSNGVEFATLGSSNIAWGGATGNSTRSLIGGGNGVINTIEYVTVAALGDAVDFGDLTVARRHAGPAGNHTRGIWAGGETAGSNTITNVMDYVTFASTGNAADFGDNGGTRGAGGCGSPTRAIWGGGQTGPTGIDVIDYAAFATTGNTTDFGNLTQARANLAGCSNTTRAVWAGGSNPTPAQYNIIDYATIATTGNAVDFGDLITTVYSISGCSASHTRGMVNGGYAPSPGAYINTIQYITFATTGNAADWGDMGNARGGYLGSTSDSHGGLE